MNLSRIILLVVLWSAVNKVTAQDFRKRISQIDSLANAGLPKSAIEEVDKLETLARQYNNYAFQIKAIIYRINFTASIDEKAFESIISNLKKDINQSSYPAKPVLQSLLAEFYWRYYQNQRWQITQRTHLEKPDDDFTRWDLQTLISTVGEYYDISLKDQKKLRLTPISVLDEILVGDENTRNLRPTLYDFLLHRAIEFYLAEESALNKPRLAFSLNNAALFGSSKDFVTVNITSSDSSSTLFKGIQYLQSATRFHLQNHNKEALADLDLKRFKFLYQKSSIKSKDEFYLKALAQLAITFKEYPISADALFLEAQYYQQKDSLVKALVFVNQAIAAYPKSLGAINSKSMYDVINQRKLSVTIENNNIPDESLLALLNYRNVNKSSVFIYKIPDSKIESKFFNKNNIDSLIDFIQPLKPLQVKPIETPFANDYKAHSVEFKIDPLKSGHYILVVTDSLNFKSDVTSYSYFKVSNLAYNYRSLPNGDKEFMVMNRKNGMPLKKVSVQIKTLNQRDSFQGVTDKQGKFVFNSEKGEYDIKLVYKGDTLSHKSNYLYSNNRKERGPKQRTLIFTDRQIYRPGQTINFKALQIESLASVNKVLPNTTLKIELEDANNTIIKELTLKTNEYGSVSGSFVIPQKILSGNMTISADDGELRIRVEEYKRPTFSVSFDKVTESYKLNDTVILKGHVKAFSGYGLSKARIAYQITRNASYYNRTNNYYPNLNNYQYAQDTILTDDDGNFTIEFKSEGIVDLSNVNYNFYITADALDAAGETQTTQTYVNVGNNNIAIISSIPAKILLSDSLKFLVALNNLNRQSINGNIKVRIFLLESVSNLFKNRLWQNPDKLLMSKEVFHQSFPDYSYDNENIAQNRKILKQLPDVDLLIDTIKKNYIDLSQLKKYNAGKFKLMILAENENGDTTSIIKFIDTQSEKATITDLNDWVIPVKTNVKVGEEAEFLVGINQKINVLMEVYDGYKIVSSKWMILNKGQQQIKIPLSASNNQSVQFIMGYQNRFYHKTQFINIQKEEGLNLKFITYRNKLQPGEKEQWKLQIKGVEKQGAEMVASLYDASLDAISRPQTWNFNLSVRQNASYFNWNNYNYVSQAQAHSIYYFNGGRYIFNNYERLDLMGYNYFGGYNYAFANYKSLLERKLATAKKNEMLKAAYETNAALVKEGFDISGKTTDYQGFILPGVKVQIKGTSIFTESNSEGYFKIKVPPLSRLVFAYLGLETIEKSCTKTEYVRIDFKESTTSLHEVIVHTGYGSVAKKDVNGAVNSISSDSRSEFNYLDDALAGKVSGLQVLHGDGLAGNSNEIVIRGNNAINSANSPLYVIDGLVIENPDNRQLNPSDIAEINVLKDASATAIYGAKGANGVIVISTKKAKEASLSQQIIPRKNFNETAFFYPQLHTNENGEVLIDFTIPEALTRWHFKGFAHTTDLKMGDIENEVLTQKELSISANFPRFLREGDTITVSARLSNLTAANLKGNAHLKMINALNGSALNLFKTSENLKPFELSAFSNQSLGFSFVVPANLEALTYQLIADAGNFSDGEENTIPVLPNQMLVTESLPVMVRPGQSRTFEFNKLVKQKSSTLKNKSLTFEYTQNPLWYIVQAMPYLLEFPYDCSEQLFSRYYANKMASKIIDDMPVIKQVFEQWKNVNSNELISALEKNKQLKLTLLEETPWVKECINETEQKKRIALLFDLDKMSKESSLVLDQLQQKQLSDGGFPWFGGSNADPYITQYLVAGFGQLVNKKGFDNNDSIKISNLLKQAMKYINNKLITDYKQRGDRQRSVTTLEIHAWYAKSYFKERDTKEMQLVFDDYLKYVKSFWTSRNIYEQGMIALTLRRHGQTALAQMIERSLLEKAQQSEDYGMYWATNKSGNFWHQSPVETQSLLIELFNEAGNQEKALDEMKIWLLKNKQTNNWKTTKATVAACNALLFNKLSQLSDSTKVHVMLNNQNLNLLKPDLKVELAIGYIKTTWKDTEIKPDFGKLSITNSGKNINWGALYWQYLENLDKIIPSNTGIMLNRKYFIQKQTEKGTLLIPVSEKQNPKTGDILKVVVYLEAETDFDYVQLKDMRPSGTEPVDFLSSYKYQDKIAYYQVTKDVATNFFISELKKGKYVFEYSLRVTQPGNFSTGVTSIQCMYAPEFNAHSEGTRMIIKSK